MNMLWYPVEFTQAHEQHDPVRASQIAQCMRRQIPFPPILLDYRTGVILDGHHRTAAARALGLSVISAVCTDYFCDPRVVVLPIGSVVISKHRVVFAAVTSRLLAPKSSRHLVDGVSSQDFVTGMYGLQDWMSGGRSSYLPRFKVLGGDALQRGRMVG